MTKKRFIFDLDYTLMTADYSVEKGYFRDVFRCDADVFIDNVAELLYEYERLYPKYDIDELSGFLSRKTRLNFSPNIIKGWIETFGECPSKIEDGVVETLEYLKSKDNSLVVLTNWFLKSQLSRIKNSGLGEYFDGVYAGDFCLKPRKGAYLEAMGDYSNRNCIVIGDNLEKDYIGPRAFEIDSILYDKDDKHNKNLVKIKNMREIINRY